MSIITDFIAAFFDQPPRILIVLALVVLGRELKKNERLIDAKWIPVILPVVGIIAFPSALSESVSTIGKTAVEGFVGGCLAVWINQAYRQLFGSKSRGVSVEALLGAESEEKENADQTHKEEAGSNAGSGVSGLQHSRPGNPPDNPGMHEPAKPDHP